MDMEDREALIGSARRHSSEMGRAFEAVLKRNRMPSPEEARNLYQLLQRNGGERLQADVFLALMEALWR